MVSRAGTMNGRVFCSVVIVRSSRSWSSGGMRSGYMTSWDHSSRTMATSVAQEERHGDSLSVDAKVMSLCIPIQGLHKL